MPTDEPRSHDPDRIGRELRGIRERLRDLHDELGDREPVHPEPEGVADGDVVAMNPLTPDDEQ